MSPIAVRSYTGGQTVVHILEEIRADEDKAAMLCGEEHPGGMLEAPDAEFPPCQSCGRIVEQGKVDA